MLPKQRGNMVFLGFCGTQKQSAARMTSTGGATPNLCSTSCSAPSPQRSCVTAGVTIPGRCIIQLVMFDEVSVRTRAFPSVQTTTRAPCKAAMHEGNAEAPQPSSTTAFPAQVQSLYATVDLERFNDWDSSTAG